MSLATLIRKGGLRFATATPATLATLEPESGGTVATVATVAVANPETAQSIPDAIGEPSEPHAGVRVVGARPENTDPLAVRDRLLSLAEAQGIDTALVRALAESFLRDCEGMDDQAMRALLSMLADDVDRKAGRIPKGDTAAILCHHCGPVFVHPAIAAVLPVVDGWPRSIGCPWCFVHLPEGHHIPRPHVECADCRHYQPDGINPAQGMGRCTIDANHGGTNWPHQARTCRAFTPKASTP